jgi:proton glutamate symport protein
MLIKILLTIVLATVVGNFVGESRSIFGISFYSIFSFGGQLFLQSLTLLVVPLVMSALVSGLSQLGGSSSFGRLGLKTIGFYVFTISLAVLTGVFFFNIIHPTPISLGQHVAVEQVNQIAIVSPGEAFSKLLLKLIPSNIVYAAAEGNMLGIIFFSLIFGYAIAKVGGQGGNLLTQFWQAIFQTMMKIAEIIMKILPLGVFCLVAKVVASGGMQSIQGLGYFILTVVLALGFFIFGLLPLLLKCFGISPVEHLKKMMPALITAFSTSSSAASLPVTMECVEGLGVSRRICGFVIPLGTSLNMAGSALYECVAALFIAQSFGVEMTIGYQILIAVLSLITSMGITGIPSASLVAIIIILNTMGVPAEGIALVIPVDRLLDMCRTTANVYSDATCATLVAHMEGEALFNKRALAT